MESPVIKLKVITKWVHVSVWTGSSGTATPIPPGLELVPLIIYPDHFLESLLTFSVNPFLLLSGFPISINLEFVGWSSYVNQTDNVNPSTIFLNHELWSTFI